MGVTVKKVQNGYFLTDTDGKEVVFTDEKEVADALSSPIAEKIAEMKEGTKLEFSVKFNDPTKESLEDKSIDHQKAMAT